MCLRPSMSHTLIMAYKSDMSSYMRRSLAVSHILISPWGLLGKPSKRREGAWGGVYQFSIVFVQHCEPYLVGGSLLLVRHDCLGRNLNGCSGVRIGWGGTDVCRWHDILAQPDRSRTFLHLYNVSGAAEVGILLWHCQYCHFKSMSILPLVHCANKSLEYVHRVYVACLELLHSNIIALAFVHSQTQPIVKVQNKDAPTLQSWSFSRSSSQHHQV